MTLSRQQEIIVNALRDKQWHCGREWLNKVKDDRARLTSLNREYMREKGWEIIGEPCRGQICGKDKCPLFKRKAIKLTEKDINARQIEFFNNLEPITV